MLWNSIPTNVQEEYYNKTRPLNPSLVQRRTVLVMITW